jgi:hypothetical protein
VNTNEGGQKAGEQWREQEQRHPPFFSLSEHELLLLLLLQ